MALVPDMPGAAEAAARGPVIGTTLNRSQRNVIGSHRGSYGVYRVLSVAAGKLPRSHRADLTDTAPKHPVGPHPAWAETDLCRALIERTGGMDPELVTRSDQEVFLPPIGGQTLFVFGRLADLADVADPAVTLTARVHDECNGSGAFGSDICTCRSYRTHAIEECIQGAHRGGVGLTAYSRKEGRALGEVTKFLVYNARKRQIGGDRADKHSLRTECAAGVQAMRLQELVPDVLHGLGIRRIHRLVSMSNDPYDAITGSGTTVGEPVKVPDALVTADARVEIVAKIAARHLTDGAVPDGASLANVKGRDLE